MGPGSSEHAAVPKPSRQGREETEPSRQGREETEARESRELTGGLRRRPRLSLRVPVRVSGAWTDQVQAFVPLLARSVNVSEGGMTVVTPLLLEEGCPVMCSMRLDGEPVYMGGRVAWCRRTGDEGLKTMGIEFGDGPEADRVPLRRALSRFSAEHPIALRFDGRDEQIRALACTDGAQLRVSARLPFLRSGRRVQFELGEPDRSYRARVHDVTVEDAGSAPTIEVWLTVDADQRASLREQVERMEGRSLLVDPDAGVRELPPPQWIAEVEPPPGIAALEPPPPAPARREPRTAGRAGRGRWGFAAACGASLALGVLLAELIPSRQVDAAVRPAAGVSPELDGAQAAPALDRARAVPGPASAAASSHVTSAGAQPLGTAASAKPGPAPVRSGSGLELVLDDDGRTVRVPIEGTTEGMHSFRLASPPGVGVDLPAARAQLKDAKYVINQDGLLWLRVREHDGGTSLRLFARDAVDEYRVEEAPERVDLVLPPEP